MNNSKRLILLLAVIITSVSLYGQARYFDERYITTQAYINPVLVNPGATGSSDYHRLIGSYRSNWSTFPGAPKSYWLSYDGSVGNRIGLGGLVLKDTNGDLETTKGQGTISYSIVSETNKIGFGLAGEFVQHVLDGSVVSEPLNGGTDATVLNRINGVQFFDVSLEFMDCTTTILVMVLCCLHWLVRD